MILTKEIKKKGKDGFLLANLDITQPAPMTIRVEAGPVFWQGENHTLVENSDYAVDEAPEKRWIGIYLAKETSSGKLVVFIDEDTWGEPGFDFNKSKEYIPIFKLGEVTVPAGVKTLDDAPMFMRRWIDEGELCPPREGE